MGRKLERATRILYLGLYETLKSWGRDHERLEHVEGLLVKDPNGRLWRTERELYEGITDDACVPLVDPASGETSAADFFDYKQYRVVGYAPKTSQPSSRRGRTSGDLLGQI